MITIIINIEEKKDGLVVDIKAPHRPKETKAEQITADKIAQMLTDFLDEKASIRERQGN